MIIGYMHYRKKPLGLNRAYAFAAVAKAEGAELLYFSPGAVDFENRVVNGYIYRDGKWVNTVSRFPDVVYNTTGFSRDKQIEAVDRLQEEIPFTSYSIGNKVTVFNNLMKYKLFANYLLPSEKVLSEKHFFTLADLYPEMVLKPSSGHQGENIYYIKREGSSFRVLSGAEEMSCTVEEMSDFILDKLDQDEYIIQPYINCRTKHGEPYDFRLHVQKDSKGEWVSSNIYPRLSSDGGIICNISRGGHTDRLDDFLEREFGGDGHAMKKYLEVFSRQLAAHMDEIQKELYGEELDELGIDVGLDQKQRIYIYEINWRPGHPPLNNIDLSVVKNTVQYAMFLANRRNNEERGSEKNQ